MKDADHFSEIEEKWLIGFPANPEDAKVLRRILPISAACLIDLSSLNKRLDLNLEKIAKNRKAVKHTAYDSYYTAAAIDNTVLTGLTFSSSGSDSESSGYISYTANGIDKRLLVFVKNDGDDQLSLYEQFQGFSGILNGYSSHLTERAALGCVGIKIQTPYGFRVRRIEEGENRQVVLTAKYKTKRKDKEPEVNAEREFYVSSNEEAGDFLGALGFEYKSSKTKKKVTYDFNYQGNRVKCEKNEITELAGATFLEIEIEGSIMDKAVIYDTIHTVATKLGIKDSKLKLGDGGLLVTDGYIKLIKNFASIN